MFNGHRTTPSPSAGEWVEIESIWESEQVKKKRVSSCLPVALSLLLFTGAASAVGFFEELGKALGGNQSDTTAAAEPARVAPEPEPETPQEPPPEPDPTGHISKTSNLRAGPGTSNAKLGMVTKGTPVTILSEQGKWYQVDTEIAGEPVTGWIYAPLVEVDEVPASSAVADDLPPPAAPAAQIGPNGTIISYAGYSKTFQPVKQMMERGDLKGVERFFAKQEAKIRKATKNERELVEEIGLLRWLERGTLDLDKGSFPASVKDFSNAEHILEVRQGESKASGFLETVAKFTVETAVGNEELQDYPGEGYERVLMLNLKSIAYLLQGKRQAYNVTRRAIDWQNMEKKAFERRLRDAKDELAKKQRENQGSRAKDAAAGAQQAYAALDAKASSVPSAYVNPFGFYVAGMVQEYESYDDWSLRDNARISYQKALELNPSSEVLKEAVKAMKAGAAPDGTRLVHVVVADGFVPEKKMLTYYIGAGRQRVPIKLSIYQPVPSSVSRIEVQTTAGKRLARLSPVADIEAISLRNQKDSEPFRQLRVMLAVISSVATKGLLNNLGVFGQVISQVRDEMAAPDMRSWMSLPKTIQATRLRLRKGIRKLKIVSYDKRGRRLASRTVEINRDSHDFVYVRSLNKMMYAHSAKKLWMLAGQ